MTRFTAIVALLTAAGWWAVASTERTPLPLRERPLCAQCRLREADEP